MRDIVHKWEIIYNANMANYLKFSDPLAYAQDEWPPELFMECGIPGYATPKVHAGLPRVGRQIKDNFANSEAVFRHYIDKAFLCRYQGVPFPMGKPLIIFTWVMNDGMGDWTAQMEVATLLKRAFPLLPIHLITLVEEGTSRYLSHPDCPSHLLFYKGYEEAVIPSHLISLMQSASLILQIPTYYPHFSKLMNRVVSGPRKNQPRHLLVGEYGFLDSEWFHPSSIGRCMGLHVLEKGLLINEKLPQAQSSKTPYYFAYLATERGHAVYLHALCRKLQKESDDIVVYLCHLHRLLPVLQEKHFSSYGISAIVIEEGFHRSIIKLNDDGKKLILRRLSNQSQEEITTLMRGSQDFVGCRGDRSFSELVSTGALFFYDAPHHAKPFLHDLYLLAKDRLLGYPLLLEYLSLMRDFHSPWDDLGRKMGLLLLEPSLYAGMAKLSALIKEEYSFNQSLIDLITYEMLLYYFPLMMEGEQQLLQQFVTEQRGFKAIIERPQLSTRL